MGSLRRADDVREEHRRKDSLSLGCGPCPGQELLKLGGQPGLVASPEQVLASWQLEVPSARNAIRQIAAEDWRNERGVRMGDHQGWHSDRRQQVPHVALE